MAGLADDWPENRQTCVDVLCAYLRLPYHQEPGDDVHRAERAHYRANQELRHTVIRVITAHLQTDMAETKSWQSAARCADGCTSFGASRVGAAACMTL